MKYLIDNKTNKQNNQNNDLDEQTHTFNVNQERQYSSYDLTKNGFQNK